MKIPVSTYKDRATISRFSIPYRVYGNGGPHLVCLNGVQQSMAMWHSFIVRFAPSYRIILFDFPGQGKGTVNSGSVKVSIDEQVEVLDEIIKSTGVYDITLCSASWGGVVAMAYAVKYPKIVKRLILAGMGTKPNKAMVEVIKKGCTIDLEKRAEAAEILIESFGKRLPETIKQRIYRQFCAMSKENLRAFCEHGLFVLSAKSLGDIIDFNNIKAETILLNGEQDTIVDLDDVKLLSNQIPRCKMKIVKNVGHFLHLEDERVLGVYDELLHSEI